MDLRFSGLDVGSFGRIDLSRYNVLVFPPVWGGASRYRQLLGAGGADRLRRWVEAGGTAIGIGGGARMLADPETGLTAARFRGQALEESSVAGLEHRRRRGRAGGTARRPPVCAWPTPPKTRNDEERRETGPRPSSASLYDVAPILGAGALPFADGHDQGTALGGEPVPMDEWLQEILPPGKKKPEERTERADDRLRDFMPQGVLLRAELDPELWLNFGLGDEIVVWFGSDDSLIAAPPVAVAARFPEIDRLHLGGLLWPEAAARLAHTAYATREGLGRGQVILFADHPVYRRWMVESERMFINAMLLGPGLGTRWSTPW